MDYNGYPHKQNPEGPTFGVFAFNRHPGLRPGIQSMCTKHGFRLTGRNDDVKGIN